MALTFSRASTATYIDAAGLVQTAAVDVLRDGHYVNAVRTLRIESIPATNYAYRSSNFVPSGSDWAGSNTTSTAAYAVAPDGTTTGTRLVGTNPAGYAHWATLNHGVGLAAGVWTASWWMKNNGGTTGMWYQVQNDTAGTSLLGPVAYTISNVWQRFSVTFTVPAGTPIISVRVVYNTAATSTDAIGWGMQGEPNPFPTSYIPTAGATATRAADVLSLDFQNTAEAMSGLFDLYEVGRTGVTGSTFSHIGNTAGGTPYFEMGEKYGALAGSLNTKMHNGTTSTISPDGPTYTSTQHIEARVVLNSTGTHGVTESVDSGTESTLATATSPGALVNWSATTRLSLGGYGAVVGGCMSIAGMAWAQGVQTLTTLRAMLGTVSSTVVTPGLGALTVTGLAPSVTVRANPTYFGAAPGNANIGAVNLDWRPGHQLNDIGLAVVHTSAQAINTIPTGWAEVNAGVDGSPQSVGLAAGAGSVRLTLLWKRAASSAEPSQSIGDSGDHNACKVFVFRGCIATGVPWDVTAGDTDAAATTAVTIPGLTTTVNNCIIAAFYAHAVDLATAQFSGGTNASLSTVTAQGESNFTAGTGGGYGLVTGIKAVAGVVSPTTGSLATASKQARMVVALRATSVNVVLTPAVGAVTVTGFAPTVVATQRATPGTGAVALTGLAPTVLLPVVVRPGTGDLTVTGLAPSITSNIQVVVQPGLGALTVTGLAPTITVLASVTAQPAVGVVTVTGFAPTVVITGRALLTPGLGQLTITGLAPTVLGSPPPVSGVDPYAWFPGDGRGRRYEEYADEEEKRPRRRKKKPRLPQWPQPIVLPPPLGITPLAPLAPFAPAPPFPTMPPGVQRMVRPVPPPPVPYAGHPYTPEQEAEELALYWSLLSPDPDASERE